MTLEERANAIAACRNGVVPGSHLHRRIVAYAIQMMQEAIDDELARAMLAASPSPPMNAVEIDGEKERGS